MLGSSGTRPRLCLHPMCPYGLSLGGDATAQNLLLAEVPFPMQPELVQRSLQTLSKHPAAGQGGRPAARCSFCRARQPRRLLSEPLSAPGELRDKACDSSAQPTAEPVFGGSGWVSASLWCQIKLCFEARAFTSLLECLCFGYSVMQVRRCAVRLTCDKLQRQLLM